jgi:hypothetical protein
MTPVMALVATIMIHFLRSQDEREEFPPGTDLIYRLKAIDLNTLAARDWEALFEKSLTLINQI